MNNTIIRVQNLEKDFEVREKGEGLKGGFKSLFKPATRHIRAVDQVSFEVPEAESLAFIGPNGAGKSTTIKILTGILFPTAGKAEVLGFVPWESRRSLAYEIGSVFGQRSQLWYHLPPSDSLTLLSKIYEIPDKEYRHRLDELTELFELQELMTVPVRKMSLGQRMRCEIAGSLLHKPKVIFLDEPTIGLDVVAKQKIRDLIKRMNREEGLTVFLTSHDSGDIEQLCKRVIIINHGHMVLDSQVSDLKRDYMHHKIVGIRMESPIDVDSVNIKGVKVLKYKGRGIKLKIDTQITDVSAALAQLMQVGILEDINVSDPPLEEIISNIYQDKGGEIGCKPSVSA